MGLGLAVGDDAVALIRRAGRFRPASLLASSTTARTNLTAAALLVLIIGGCTWLRVAATMPAAAPGDAGPALAATERTNVRVANIRAEAAAPDTAASTAPVSLLVVSQRTILPRVSDTPATARAQGVRGVTGLVTLRVQEDRNFALKARNLGHRMQRDAGRFAREPERVRVLNGADFLDALVAASRTAPIGNLVIFGHSAPGALYMREDRGFYASLAEVAEATRVVEGTVPAKESELRALGARDLDDLAALVESGAIRFAPDAVIVFTGCSAAGHRDIDAASLAARTAKVTGAVVFASVDVTDQSMAGRRAGPPELEYSRRSWARFDKDGQGTRLNSRVLDPLKQLRPDAAPAAPTADQAMDATRPAGAPQDEG